MKWLDLNTATGTWAGHAVLSYLVGLLFVLGLAGFGFTTAAFAFVLGTAVMAVYFALVREELDKLRHLLLNDYDEPSEEDGVSPRVDRVGDMLGPLALAVGALTCWIIGLLS